MGSFCFVGISYLWYLFNSSALTYQGRTTLIDVVLKSLKQTILKWPPLLQLKNIDLNFFMEVVLGKIILKCGHIFRLNDVFSVKIAVNFLSFFFEYLPFFKRYFRQEDDLYFENKFHQLPKGSFLQL